MRATNQGFLVPSCHSQLETSLHTSLVLVTGSMRMVGKVVVGAGHESGPADPCLLTLAAVMDALKHPPCALYCFLSQAPCVWWTRWWWGKAMSQA